MVDLSIDRGNGNLRQFQMISPHILPNKYKSSRNKLLENFDVVILWLLEPSALLAWAVSVGVSVGVSSDSLEQGR